MDICPPHSVSPLVRSITRLVSVLICVAAMADNGRPRPNILLIVSEDNGPELGCYGEPYVKTPNLDRLAAQGVRFDRAYVPQAGCSQSRAAYLTGLYPHQNGQIGLATWKFTMYTEKTPNLVRSLKEAGYRTGIIGKLHVNPKSAFPFDFQKITTSNFARKKLKNYATEAQAFINESDKPFLLSVNYPDPHRPFTKKVGGLPKDPLDPKDVKPFAYFGPGVDTPDLREQVANYYNCMSRLDSLVGDLLEVLKESGKADDTLIIYFGDHGADLLRGKRTSYEGGVRVRSSSSGVIDGNPCDGNLSPRLICFQPCSKCPEPKPFPISPVAHSFGCWMTKQGAGARICSPNFTLTRVTIIIRSAPSVAIASS